jgi:hypothetical protein
MSDDTRGDLIEETFPRLVHAGRWVAAVLVAGTLSALAWMFILQEGHTGRIFGRTWTQHDFPDGLGHLFGAADTSRAGLWLTLGLGVVVALVYVAIERLLPGKGAVKGVAFAPLLFLAWGLVFTPLVNSRQMLEDAEFVYRPAGAFARHAGNGTFVLAIAASLIAGLMLARVTQMMRAASWWREHPVLTHGIADESTASELLELAEQRPEERMEGAR